MTPKDFVPYRDVVHRGAQQIAALFRQESVATIRKLASVATGKTAKTKALRAIESLPGAFRAMYSESGLGAKMLPEVRKAARMGATTCAAGTVLSRAEDEVEVVTAGFADHIRFYADNYVSRIIVPALRKTVIDADPDELQTELLAKAQQLFAGNDSYWHNVVHQGISNSYHYGMTKAADMVGCRKLMYLAVLDDRTTDFCRALDGQTVAVDPVLKKLVDFSTMTGPSVKKYMPWSVVKSSKNPSVRTLLRKGFVFPPFHAHCRTTFHPF